MAFIADYALDALVEKIREGTRIDLCSLEPANYTAATSTNSLGNKTGLTMGAVADRSPTGRKTSTPAIAAGAPGNGTANGNASHWALTDPANTRLLSTGSLAVTQAIANGNTFTLPSFDIGVADAA